jgi:hypothetical protein
MAFVKPCCSSLVAAQYLEQKTVFAEFCGPCRVKNDGFYRSVDEKVTSPVLQQAASIALDAPTEPVRQDDEGVVPRFKFYSHLAFRKPMSFDHESAVAQAYSFLGQGLVSVFESDVQRVFDGFKIVTVAPKAYQRMQNKLLNPAEHGDPSIPRPRCAKNVDVLRGCIIVKNVQDLEEAYNKLRAAFKVVRVKNTHNPSTDGWAGGYRSLLVNFVYDPGVKWGQLFGDKVTFDFSDEARFFGMRRETPVEESHLANLWLDYLPRDNLRNLFALQGLQVIASEHPHEPVRMIAELQLVFEPYFEGRAVSHLLFKIARCDTGAMEMVRDFHQEYFHKDDGQLNKYLQVVRDIAMASREGREPPTRIPVQ